MGELARYCALRYNFYKSQMELRSKILSTRQSTPMAWRSGGTGAYPYAKKNGRGGEPGARASREASPSAPVGAYRVGRSPWRPAGAADKAHSHQARRLGMLAKCSRGVHRSPDTNYILSAGV